MQVSLICFLVIVLFKLSDACPYGGITAYHIDQCYIYSGLKTTWVNAENICQYLGGHLISIQTDEENSYVARVLHSPSLKEIYIGAYVNGHYWEWTDYSKFCYQYFRGRVTNSSDNVSSMILTQQYYSEWNVLSSTSPVPNSFACQVPNCAFADKQPNVAKHLKNVGYYDSNTTYVYFGTVANQENFADAEDECMRIGGHLPSISNAFENAAVQNAVQKLLGTNFGGKIIIGYSNLMNKGFTWSDGNPSKFTNWAPGEPVTVVAGVAWMDFLTGWWNTAAPLATSHFICALPSYRINC